MADRLPNFSSLHQLQTVPDAVLEQMGWHKSKLFSNTLYWPPSSDRPSLSATHRRERSPLWLCRFDRITNHESPIRRASLAQGGPLTFHFSPFTNPLPSHLSPITSHFSRPRQRPSSAPPGFLPYIVSMRRSWAAFDSGGLQSCGRFREDTRQRI
jgi:hypothetical protein